MGKPCFRSAPRGRRTRVPTRPCSRRESPAGGRARDASTANVARIEAIVSALRRAGIEEKDIQTRALNVQRVDWGDRKGQYQASNIVNVTVRKVGAAGRAVTAATDAGANIVSGPELRIAEPERAANGAYAAAYKAAHARAEAYADAAGMKISRVLTIREAGGTQGDRYLMGAMAVAPPPMAVEQSASGARWPPDAGTDDERRFDTGRFRARAEVRSRNCPMASPGQRSGADVEPDLTSDGKWWSARSRASLLSGRSTDRDRIARPDRRNRRTAPSGTTSAPGYRASAGRSFRCRCASALRH